MGSKAWNTRTSPGITQPNALTERRTHERGDQHVLEIVVVDLTNGRHERRSPALAVTHGRSQLARSAGGKHLMVDVVRVQGSPTEKQACPMDQFVASYKAAMARFNQFSGRTGVGSFWRFTGANIAIVAGPHRLSTSKGVARQSGPAIRLGSVS